MGCRNKKLKRLPKCTDLSVTGRDIIISTGGEVETGTSMIDAKRMFFYKHAAYCHSIEDEMRLYTCKTRLRFEADSDLKNTMDVPYEEVKDDDKPKLLL